MRPYNFSPGPAVLPEPVLERIRHELMDWNGTGCSVMEVSHRGKDFMAFATRTEATLRSLLAVPDNYKVLFMQGGASGQFAIVPLNLLGDKSVADYVNTGQWSNKAIGEAQRYCTVNLAAEDSIGVPAFESWRLSADAAYLHYTPNETIGGVEYHWIPESGDVPLVGDFSSSILSRPLDVSRFGVIYAGAQKNIGPAGITLVLVRDDLLDNARPETPGAFSYKQQAAADSMSNTPPVFAWYVAGLVFEWIVEQGGLAAMENCNQRKADVLYAAIDESGFYSNPVRPDSRSRMNVPFTLADPSLDSEFLAGSVNAGLLNLKGHRIVGGMRASLYNAMPEEGVLALVEFMREFERKFG